MHHSGAVVDGGLDLLDRPCLRRVDHRIGMICNENFLSRYPTAPFPPLILPYIVQPVVRNSMSKSLFAFAQGCLDILEGNCLRLESPSFLWSLVCPSHVCHRPIIDPTAPAAASFLGISCYKIQEGPV